MGTALENGSLKFVSVIHELLNGGETTDLVPLNNLVTSHFSATALLLLHFALASPPSKQQLGEAIDLNYS